MKIVLTIQEVKKILSDYVQKSNADNGVPLNVNFIRAFPGGEECEAGGLARVEIVYPNETI